MPLVRTESKLDDHEYDFYTNLFQLEAGDDDSLPSIWKISQTIFV